MVNHKRKYYRAALEKEVIFIIIPWVKKKKATGGHFCPSVAPVVWGRYNSKPNLNPKLQLTWFAFKTL